MACEKIIGEIEKIKQIVEDWQKTGEVYDVEKDVVLDKLRQIYECVKFGEAKSGAGRKQAVAIQEPIARIEVSPEVAAPAEVISDLSADQAHDIECVGNVCSVGGKVKHDRKKLMSLYGDGEQSAENPGVVAKHEDPIYRNSVPVGKNDDVINAFIPAQEPHAAPAAKPFAGHNLSSADNGQAQLFQNKVLGETLKTGETLADVYARNNKSEDVADRIKKNESMQSIRGAIGINDRFLLIRDLFAGNAAECDKTISELDGFSDLDDALLYIHDNFSWNPESDGAKLLVELLTRKLS